MDSNKTALSIPSALYARIEKAVEEGRFEGPVEDFVIKTLEEKLGPDSSAEDLSREDEDKIKERLKALGYMD